MFLPVSSVRCALSRLFLFAVCVATAAQAQVPAPLPKPNVALTLAGEVSSVAYQPDGALLLVGTFTSINGVPRDGLARLLPDGSLDPLWYPRARWSSSDTAYVERRVYALPDGGVLVQGDITHVNGQVTLGCGAKLSAGSNPILVPSWHVNAGGCATVDLSFDDQGWYYYSWLGAIRRGRADTGAIDETWVGRSAGLTAPIHDGRGGLIHPLTYAGLARVLIATGEADPNWQPPESETSGIVGGVVDSSAGFVYLIYVDGKVGKLALATGQSADGWPRYAPYGMTAIALGSDDDLYLGGWNGVVRLSATTGQVLADWRSDGVSRSVRVLERRADGRVAVGGNFARLGTSPVMGAALLTPAAPQPAALALAEREGVVLRLARQPDGGVIAAGAFDRANGNERLCLLRIEPNGSLDADWAPRAAGWIRAMATDANGDVYIGGSSLNIDGHVAYGKLAKISGSTGAVQTGYYPETGTNSVSGLVVDGSSRVYLAGDGTDRLVRRLLPDGSLDAGWGTAGAMVTGASLQRVGDELYVGVDGVELGHFQLRRVSMLTGADDADWSVAVMPQTPVSIARADGGDLFIRGYFNEVNGVPRNYLARVSSTVPAQLRAWDPSPDGFVRGLGQTSSGRLFVSGDFTRIGGKPRNGNAELAPTDGQVLDSWMAPVGGGEQLLADDRIYFSQSPRGLIAYPLEIGDTIFAASFD